MRAKLFDSMGGCVWTGDRDAFVACKRFPHGAVNKIVNMTVGDVGVVVDNDGNDHVVQIVADGKIGVVYLDFSDGLVGAMPQRKIFDSRFELDTWLLQIELDNRDVRILSEKYLGNDDVPAFLTDSTIVI